MHVDQALLFPALEAGDENKVRFLFGPIYQFANVKEDSNAEFTRVFPDLNEGDLKAKQFLGVNTQFTYDPFVVDTMPGFEVRFLVNTGYVSQLRDSISTFGFIRGYISFLYNIYSKKSSTPVLTLATRFGGGFNTGDFDTRDFQF